MPCGRSVQCASYYRSVQSLNRPEDSTSSTQNTHIKQPNDHQTPLSPPYPLFHTFSRSPSRTLARTRPATKDISKRSGEFDSALVSKSKPAARVVLNRITNSSVCVRVPCEPPNQIVMCCVPLKASVADSRPHVGPVYSVAEQSHNGRFHPSLQIPLFWHGGTAPVH